MNLKPQHIKSIFSENFEKFIHNGRKNKAINIISVKDTFESPILSKIFDKLQTENSKQIWMIRKMTQEERAVFEHKENGKVYNPEMVKWDTLKMKRINFTNRKPQ